MFLFIAQRIKIAQALEEKERLKKQRSDRHRRLLIYGLAGAAGYGAGSGASHLLARLASGTRSGKKIMGLPVTERARKLAPYVGLGTGAMGLSTAMIWGEAKRRAEEESKAAASTLGAPKRDGSGGGIRANVGRGGCEETEEIGKGRQYPIGAPKKNGGGAIGAPKNDGSGRGTRANIGRGGCEELEEIGKGRR